MAGLTITQGSNANTFNILGVIEMVEGEMRDSIEWYNTTATLSNGKLNINSSVLSRNGISCNFTYGSLDATNPVKFRSEMHADIIGYDCGYIMTNNLQKR